MWLNILRKEKVISKYEFVSFHLLCAIRILHHSFLNPGVSIPYWTHLHIYEANEWWLVKYVQMAIVKVDFVVSQKVVVVYVLFPIQRKLRMKFVNNFDRWSMMQLRIHQFYPSSGHVHGEKYRVQKFIYFLFWLARRVLFLVADTHFDHVTDTFCCVGVGVFHKIFIMKFLLNIRTKPPRKLIFLLFLFMWAFFKRIFWLKKFKIWDITIFEARSVVDVAVFQPMSH